MRYTATTDTGLYKAPECTGSKWGILKAGHSIERAGISATGRAIKAMYKGNIAWVAKSKLVAGAKVINSMPVPVLPKTPTPLPPIIGTVIDAFTRALTRLKTGYTPGWALTQAGRLSRYGGSESVVRPKLVSVKWKGRTFLIHALEVDRFRGWIADIAAYEKAHAANYVFRETYSFCWRKIAGGTLLSNHSFGIAIDINPGQNPMQSSLETDIPRYFRTYAKKWGIRWGGDYSSRKDAMHFEL